MPLNSLMFGWEYPPLHTGGLGVACQGLVRGLRKHGVAISLVLPMAQGTSEHGVDIVTMGQRDGVNIITVPSIIQPYDTPQQYAQRMGTRAGDVVAMNNLYGPNLYDAVEKYTELSVQSTAHLKPDVIHCHDWMTYAAGARAATHHNVPLVAHVHATEYDRTNFNPDPWIADKEQKGLESATGIIAVSHYTKQMLVSQYGIDQEKVHVVHNGHDMEMELRAESHDPRPLVLFLGRLTIQKNPWQFLRIAQRIRHFMPDVRFAVAGEGGLMPQLMDDACRLGIGDCTLFCGKVSKEEAMNLYQLASCFVMPSLSEPFGLVALEAIAHGTPVVLSRQSGAAEVLEHAFKADYWDTDKFADCIMTILREKPLHRQLRSYAFNSLKHLSWQNQAHKVQSIYHYLTA